MAKRKSLFDDKAVEIEELTYIIKQVSWTGNIPGSLQAICKMNKTNFGPVCVLQDINSLNKQIAQLQDLVRSRGTPSGRHIQTHSNTIVVSLQVFSKSSLRLYICMSCRFFKINFIFVRIVLKWWIVNGGSVHIIIYVQHQLLYLKKFFLFYVVQVGFDVQWL